MTVQVDFIALVLIKERFNIKNTMSKIVIISFSILIILKLLKYHALMDITKIKKARRVALNVQKINPAKIKAQLLYLVAPTSIQSWDKCFVSHADLAMTVAKIKNAHWVNIPTGRPKTVVHVLNIFTVRPQTKKRFALLV